MLQAHDVRTRHAGRLTFIDFHLVVHGDKSVARAHDICDRIEHANIASCPCGETNDFGKIHS